MFKRSDEQQSALEQLLRDQQDVNSANYHRWLRPDQFADRFGISPADLTRVTGWLQSNGFTIDYAPASRGWVTFSGSARQVQDAFATEIRRYEAGTETHFANASDVLVPSEMAPLLLGLHGLDDFYPKPGVRRTGPLPDYTTSTGAHGLSPDDYATIYDLTPLYNSGYDGSGQEIVVAGRCHIGLSDVQAFRNVLSLAPNDPQLVLTPTSPDPGSSNAEDCDEAYLDVEWAGAVARNAKILFVYGTDPLAAVQYAVGQNLAPVVNFSFGACEKSEPHSFLALLESLAQQANAQGITWVASSGDSGAAGCDARTQSAAMNGLGVSQPASVPEITAVGGTQFNEGDGGFWSSSNSATFASALSYIPEIGWNETAFVGSLSASGGGLSTYFSRPAWQNAPGVPADGYRAVPDVALAADADHDPYFTYSNGQKTWVGGTSAAAPSFAGMIALLNQYQGSRQGNINPNLYRLYQSTPSAFHDVTMGSNIVPCFGTRDCVNGYLGYSAGPGYDLVTGLGSVDANVLITNWSSNGGVGPLTLVNKLTSSTTGLVNGFCSTPPSVSTFSTSSSQAWVYFDVTGARVGDSVLISYIRPDGVLYTNQSASVSAPGSKGYQCFSSSMPISGTAAASYPGTWTVQAFWDQSSTPLFTLNFLLVGPPPTITSLVPMSVMAGSGAFTMTVYGSNFTAGAMVRWNGTALPTTFISSTQLTTSVAASLVASAGVVSISVLSGGQQSGSTTFTISTPPGGNISLANQRVTTQAPPATGCVVPPSATSFLTTNNTAYLYFEATETLNDSLSSDWLAPDGSVVSPASWSKQSGSFCFTGAALNISKLTSRQLGTWSARIYDNGALVATVPFTVSAPGITPTSNLLLYFVPLALCHLVDTRGGQPGEFGQPSMSAGQTRTFHPNAGACPGIPTSAKAFSLNVTAAAEPGGSLSYLTLWPTGQPQPFVSTLNGPKGGSVSNAAIVPAGTAGGINAFVTDDADLMVDINGYFDNTVSANSTAFYALAPCRVADTRNPNGPLGGPQMAAGLTRNFLFGSSSCLPGNAGITAYSLNVTAIPTQPLASLAIWMGNAQRPPLVSTLSASFGDVTASATVAMASVTDGSINAFVSDRTDIAFDINGYFGAPGAPGALLFQPVTPCRILDTRGANGPFGGPVMLGGTTRTFAVPSSGCNIPAAAKAYSLNVTVVPTGPLGYLSIWPSGQSQPYVSTLNSWDGRVVANAAIVPAGQNGAVGVYVSDSSHVIIDVNGYFAAP